MAEHAYSPIAPDARPLISPTDRERLEAALEHLGRYHDRFARHARRAANALARIDRLRHSAIAALDRIDAETEDLEPDGSDEPSLAFQEVRSFESQDAMIQWSPLARRSEIDLEEVCEDEGAEHDGREPDADDEPSLTGIGMTIAGAYGVYCGGQMHYDLEVSQ